MSLKQNALLWNKAVAIELKRMYSFHMICSYLYFTANSFKQERTAETNNIYNKLFN